MTSKVQIFNMALVLLEQQIVNSPTQEIITAINILNVYDIIRKDLLRRFEWNFATARVELAVEVGAAPDDSSYLYSYALPADCLKVREVYLPYSNYVIEGRSLLTDDDEVFIRYTFDEDDESQFDASFVRVFAYELALAAGPSLGVTDAALERIRRQYKELLKEARRVDQQEDRRINVYPSSTWITSR